MGINGYYINIIMSLTVARNERVRSVLTHANSTLLSKFNKR